MIALIVVLAIASVQGVRLLLLIHVPLVTIVLPFPHHWYALLATFAQLLHFQPYSLVGLS